VLTDNAWAYTRSRVFSQLLGARARSSTSPASPTAPVATGKVERFHQTMAREWAYGLVYRSHHERADALPHWLQHY